MTTVQDENGIIHNFPDDATPEEMNAAIDASMSSQKQSFLEGAKNLGEGVLSGIKSTAELLPAAANLGAITGGAFPAINLNNNPISNFDPYKATGTTPQPVSTPAGAEQVAGQFLMPTGAAGDAASLAGSEAVQAAGGVKNFASQAAGDASDLAGKVINMFSPQKQTEALLQDLGKGAANSQEGAESIASDIKSAHDMRADQAGAFLDYPLEAAGNEKIYPSIDPLITTQMDQGKALMDKVSDLNVGDLYNTFKNNPTFQNAHNLQSELGVMIGDLQKNPYLTIAEKQQIGNIQNVRETLKSHIMDFLQNRDANSNENLAPMYQKGSDLYRDNVAPYLSSEKLRDITRGGKTSVDNIENEFQNPSNIKNSDGSISIGPINKILSDLPQDTKDKILFNQIGANSDVNNPQNVVQSIVNADQKGFSHLVSPDVRARVSAIQRAIANKNILKYAGAPIVGGTVGAGVYGLGSNLFRNLMNNSQPNF